ncbi:substrate-binding periplasmic protein [Pseudomonas sp. Marseille-QA0892]
MTFIRFCLRVLLLANAMLVAQAQAHSIQIVTEELPPYNMTVDGKLTGMSTEVVKAVLADVGIDATFQAMPWARAYDTALHGENVMIYSIARTPERESQFKWVGMVAPMRWYLYSAASRPLALQTLDQAMPYQIATVKQDVGEQYLTERGFQVGSGLQSSVRHELNYEKL